MNILSTGLDEGEGSATQRAYVVLRRMIVEGDLKPGEKLKIEGLRRRLDIGASPIREALSLLTSDNLVERLDQRGFRAAPISAENFEEILALRCTLEDMALRQTIEVADDAWEEGLVLAHHRMRRAKGAEPGVFELLHKAFHMALLANTRSPILYKFCSQLYDLNIRYRFLAGNAMNYRARNVGDEHQGILDAAVARDADTASARLISHYRRTGEFVVELIGSGGLR
ncbi:MAG: GntR family transcriptional regulator [Pseudomonadota bacterium]